MYRRRTDIEATAAAAMLSCGAVVANAPLLITTVLGIALFASLGYVWAKILFGHYVAGLELVATATGLALVVPIVGGLALQAAGVPLHRVAWTSLVAAVTLAGDVVLVALDRTAQPAVSTSRSARWRWPRGHAIIFGAAVTITAGAVALASFGAAIQHYPGFTQLWLSTRGNGSIASLGVSNQQGSTKHYRLILLRKGRPSDSWDLTLSNDQTWQRTILISRINTATVNLYLLPDLTRPYRHVSSGS